MPERFWSLIAGIPLLMSDVNVDVDVDVNRVFGGKSTHRSQQLV